MRCLVSVCCKYSSKFVYFNNNKKKTVTTRYTRIQLLTGTQPCALLWSQHVDFNPLRNSDYINELPLRSTTSDIFWRLVNKAPKMCMKSRIPKYLKYLTWEHTLSYMV